MTRWCNVSFIRQSCCQPFFVEQVIQLPNEKFRFLEWDPVPVQNMHQTQTRGPVYVDLSDGATGKLQKSNYSKYDPNDATSPVNTYSNGQGFMVVWKTIPKTTELLWDYGPDYWVVPKEEVIEPTVLYAQPMHEHKRERRHCSQKRKTLIENMRVMISNVGYVLYKLDDREHRKLVARIDRRYDDPKFKRSQSDDEPGWRSIFNKGFRSTKDPTRWQGPFKCDVKEDMPLLVQDVDSVSQAEGDLVQPNVLETDQNADSQLFHYDHAPLGGSRGFGVKDAYAPVEVGFVIISVGDDVSLDVVPGSQNGEKFPTTKATNKAYTVPGAKGKRIRIPPGYAILAHPLLIHAGTNGIGPRDNTRRVHLYR